MNQTIFVLLTSAFIFQAQAQEVDLDCLPSRAWDTGYQVRLAKMEDDTYQAALDAWAIFGKIAKYRGEVRLSLAPDSPDCLLKIETLDPTGEPFEVQINENGEAMLMSVSGQPVKDYVREMMCNRSDQFIADQKAMCQLDSSNYIDMPNVTRW